MPSDRQILDYQQKCFKKYGRSVGLPAPYTYPDGNPIRPLPPVQTATNGLMIIGAYPSARFEQRPGRSRDGRYRLVPVADNLQPFGDEEYFDGVRVRSLPSADGLKEYLLLPLGLSLKKCWVTDLVKVFLYKPSHADSCGDVHPDFEVPVLRNDFHNLGENSLPWLQEEAELCNPPLIVTLGLEVAQVVSGERSAPADDLLARDLAHPQRLDHRATLYLPHPEACSRFAKWRKRMAERIEEVRSFLSE